MSEVCCRKEEQEEICPLLLCQWTFLPVLTPTTVLYMRRTWKTTLYYAGHEAVDGEPCVLIAYKASYIMSDHWSIQLNVISCD